MEENFVSKKHIVFISYYFPPMGGGGVQRIGKFLKYFDYERYHVSVLTVRRSFFYTSDETLGREIPASVNIIRSGSLDPFRLIYIFRKIFTRFSSKTSPTVHHESGGWMRKLAGAFFVPDSRLLWLPFALFRLRRLHRQHKIDLIIATMPPFTAGLIGILAQQLLRLPTALDFRDAWCQNPYLPSSGKWQQKLNTRLENYCISRARGVIFVNPALAKTYLKRFPQITEKPHVTIRNGYDPEDFTNLPDSTGYPSTHSHFNLGIMGTIYSQGNRPESLLEALRQLKIVQPNLLQKFRLTILGKWTPEFPEFISGLGIDDLVELLPYLPHGAALKRAAQFDALTLAIDSRIPGSAAVTPGRIYEYLYLQKPILALCPPNSDLANLIQNSTAGEVVDFENIEGIKTILNNWIERPAEMSERYTFENLATFNRKQQTQQLLKFIQTFF